MAFLINAYNGFTVELILGKYPNLKSIKDLGSVFQAPWKNKFFSLLGESHHLDWIEHEQLRPLRRPLVGLLGLATTAVAGRGGGQGGHHQLPPEEPEPQEKDRKSVV